VLKKKAKTFRKKKAKLPFFFYFPSNVKRSGEASLFFFLAHAFRMFCVSKLCFCLFFYFPSNVKRSGEASLFYRRQASLPDGGKKKKKAKAKLPCLFLSFAPCLFLYRRQASKA
jgi:hypothetical protein